MDPSLPWSDLQNHYESEIKTQHLRHLLEDKKRNESLRLEAHNIILDYSHV